MLKKSNRPKLFEFLTLFTITVGTVIGSGIYMKNTSLLESTRNPIIAIVLWLIVGIACIMSIYVFIEIASSTKNSGNGTIGNWTKIFINRKIASLFSLIFVIIYVPALQSIFTAMFVIYLFAAIGQPLDVSTQLTIILVVGLILIIGFSIINAFKQSWAEKIQVYGTIFKFIPLIIALVAGFALAGFKTGAFFNNSNYIGSPYEDAWSTSNFSADLFFRGFGGVLFAFDGFIYAANKQKDIKHKDVVPKSLVFGMIFIAFFYVIMAVSLFLGSPDGSIVKVLELVFSGNNLDNESAVIAARIVSNILLMIICLQGVNLLSMIGTRGVESDAKAKLIYSSNRNIDYVKASFLQMIASIISFVLFILIGGLVIRGNDAMGGSFTYDKFLEMKIADADFNEWTDYQKHQSYLGFTAGYITYYIGLMSSTGSVFAFAMILSLMIASVVNRFNNKVETDKLKYTVGLGIASSILIAFFLITSIFDSLVPSNVLNGDINWIESSGFWFLIFILIGAALVIPIYFYQEYKFKVDPFKDGFDGYLNSKEVLKVQAYAKK